MYSVPLATNPWAVVGKCMTSLITTWSPDGTHKEELPLQTVFGLVFVFAVIAGLTTKVRVVVFAH